MKVKTNLPKAQKNHEKIDLPTPGISARVNPFVNLPVLLQTLQNDLKSLSQRERQVFELRGQGLLEKEIADQLHIDINSVKTYVHRANKKLSASLTHAMTKKSR